MDKSRELARIQGRLEFLRDDLDIICKVYQSKSQITDHEVKLLNEVIQSIKEIQAECLLEELKVP